MNRNIFTGIIILIIVAVAFFVKPAKTEEHEWMINDYAYVTHVCSTPEPLIASALELLAILELVESISNSSVFFINLKFND